MSTSAAVRAFRGLGYEIPRAALHLLRMSPPAGYSRQLSIAEPRNTFSYVRDGRRESASLGTWCQGTLMGTGVLNLAQLLFWRRFGRPEGI